MSRDSNGHGRRRWRIVSLVIGWCVFVLTVLSVHLVRLAQRQSSPQQPERIQEQRKPKLPQQRKPAPLPVAQVPRTPDKIRRESGSVKSGYVFAVVFGWFVFVFIGLAVLMHAYESALPYPTPPLDSSYPAPRLITRPFALQLPYRASQQRALTTGAIPITRAMAEIAARPDPYAPITAGDLHGQ